MQKKFVALGMLLIVFVGLLAGCGSKEQPKNNESKKLIVFAAASLTETLKELGKQYESNNKNIKIVYNFDSSGTLKTQIVEGADCDVFISAGQKQMNQIDKTANEKNNPKKLDYVLYGSRFNILENKVALVVPKGNPKEISSFKILVRKLQDEKILLAMGNADVPVGQYTKKIFSYFRINEEDIAKSGKLTYGSNVKEVTTQVSEGAVDAGIIYQTDAASAKLTVVDTATKEMCGQVIYPAAVIKNAKNQAEAKRFLEFLKTAEAGAVFKRVGFRPIK